MMRRAILGAGGAVLVFTAALALVNLGFEVVLNAQKGGSKPSSGCGTDAPAVVTLANLAWGDIDGDGYGSIRSDSKGDYLTVSKGDKVEAKFQVNNCSYDLTLNLNLSKNRLINVHLDTRKTLGDPIHLQSKFFNFDRIYSVPFTVAEFDALCASNPWMNGTNFSVHMDYLGKDNYGGCGSDARGRYVRRAVAFEVGDTYRLAFNRSPFDSGATPRPELDGTAYVKVYRPTATTWVIEPDLTPVIEQGQPGKAALVLRSASPGPGSVESYHPMQMRVCVTTDSSFSLSNDGRGCDDF